MRPIVQVYAQQRQEAQQAKALALLAQWYAIPTADRAALLEEIERYRLRLHDDQTKERVE